MAKYVYLCILHNSPFGVKGIYHAFCCLILSYFIKCLNLLIKENKHTYSYHSLIFLIMAKLILFELHPGCIILCHNNGYKIKEYLPTLLKTAQEQGYEFVTVSELLLTGDTMIDVNGVQKLK